MPRRRHRLTHELPALRSRKPYGRRLSMDTRISLSKRGPGPEKHSRSSKRQKFYRRMQKSFFAPSSKSIERELKARMPKAHDVSRFLLLRLSKNVLPSCCWFCMAALSNMGKQGSTNIGYLWSATGGGLFSSFMCFCGWTPTPAISTDTMVYTPAADPLNKSAMLLVKERWSVPNRR